MKKTSISAIISLVMVFVLGISVNASSFVPSATLNAAPSVNTDNTTITDANGNAVTIAPGDIKVTATKDIPTNPTTPEEKALVAAVEEIKKSATDKTTVFYKTLTQAITTAALKTADGTAISAEDMVVRDLFDLSVSDELQKVLAAGGNIKVNFATTLKSTDVVIVMHQNIETGEWLVVDKKDISINTDGTLDVNFTSLCPIAILVNDSQGTAAGTTTGTPTNATTGDNMMPIILVAAVFVAAGIVTVVLLKKKRVHAGK